MRWHDVVLAIGALTVPVLICTPSQPRYRRDAHRSQSTMHKGIVCMTCLVAGLEIAGLTELQKRMLIVENMTHGVGDMMMAPGVPFGLLWRSLRSPGRIRGGGCAFKILS